MVPRFQVRARGGEEFGGMSASKSRRDVKRSRAIVRSSVHVRARTQKKTHAGSEATRSGVMERAPAAYCGRDVYICSFGQEYFAKPRKPSERRGIQQGVARARSRGLVIPRHHPVHVGATAYRVAQRGFVVSLYRALSILHQCLHARRAEPRARSAATRRGRRTVRVDATVSQRRASAEAQREAQYGG